jgi:maltose alpha-D-glucosyltransferase/alpha-amylase
LTVVRGGRQAQNMIDGAASCPLWYKDALIYQVHVRSYCDSNGDGVGDFPGLTSRLDYIERLGISAIWLLPFYPSPLKDDGYDIAHYEGVHPAYGTMRDFRTFLREAHARGLKVITELVINHTSDQHAWFEAARRAPRGSRKRDYYVWSDTPDRYAGVRIVFSDLEHSNWAWDATAQQYYWHRFFSHQPDLNFDNPRVVRAVVKVMCFWLDMGVDGMRLDAVPYLVEREGTTCDNLPETHAILKHLRAELDARYVDRMLLAEANHWPADVRPYFGDGDESHMAFHFPLMPRLFIAVKQEDRFPIVDVLRQTPDIPEACQWATFLRNHDELTLEMVTSEERDFMWQQYASDAQMRINMGIRRRLAPLLENDRRRIELLNSLLFSLPGTPVVYYGDEIGMGDNVYLGDRNGVRTPMQWTGDRNAGFSRADPARLFAPVVMDPVYGYQALNVEAQERAPSSLLNWMRRVITIRRQNPVFGRGTISFVEPENHRILAFVREHAGDRVLVVANLARSVQPVELDLSQYQGLVPLEMFDQTTFPRIGPSPFTLTLGPYGAYWFRLLEPAAVPSTARLAPRRAQEAPDAPPALLVGPDWEKLLDGHVRTIIERRALRPFLGRQRWYAPAVCSAGGIEIEDWIVLERGREPSVLAIVGVHCDDGSRERYLLPLLMTADERARLAADERPDRVLAHISGARTGVVSDDLPDSAIRAIAALLPAPQATTTLKAAQGTVDVETYRRPAGRDEPSSMRLTRPAEARNIVALMGDREVLKLFRRLDPGPHPEVELREHVTGPGGFGRVPRVHASLVYRTRRGESMTLGIIGEQLPQQRNGWDHAIADVERYLDRASAAGGGPPDDEVRPVALADRLDVPERVREALGGYVEIAAILGRRVAELHHALAAEGRGFGLVANLAPAYFVDVVAAIVAQAAAIRPLVEIVLPQLPDLTGRQLTRLLNPESPLQAGLAALATRASPESPMMRVHNDLNLEQILLHQGDVLFLDFEGDPDRPAEWRTRRHSPLRDLATLTHSIHYAAHAGLRRHVATRPHDEARLAPWADFWHRWISAVVLETYQAGVAGTPLADRDPAARAAGLDLLLVDQALQDLEMELRSRVDWANVPLDTVMRVCGATITDGGAV